MEEEVVEDEPSAEEKAMRMLEKQGWKIGEGKILSPRKEI